MESAPLVSQDGLDAPAPIDCYAAVFLRRLAACLACALLLAGVPTTAHWPGQTQMFVEAKADLVPMLLADMHATWIKVRPPHAPHAPHPQIHTPTPTPPHATEHQNTLMRTNTHHHAPSTAPDSETWTTIRWARYPGKCLDVAGENSGAQLQIWSCSSTFPKKQRFILPPVNSKGEIKWATNPELCLDNPLGNDLQLWTCSATPKRKRLFQVSPDGKGHSRIRTASQPSKCLDIPAGRSDNGWKVQLWDCDAVIGSGHQDNIAFITHTGVDCAWGSWSTWSACPVTCGGGSHVRSRRVEVNATKGGKACKKGDHMELAFCGYQPCKLGTKNGLIATNLDPTYFFTTSRPKVARRSWTSRARLHITFLLASLLLAVGSHSFS